jgi:ribosomal protein L3 glutamine methyltransferase
VTRTVRSLLAYGIDRFEEEGLAFGHGTTNALDEAAWLILHALGLPPGELKPHLDQPLDAAQWKAVRALLDKRVRTRKPAAYLLNEAWLGPNRFYVDERVIVPRSFIAELLLSPPRRRGPNSTARVALGPRLRGGDKVGRGGDKVGRGGDILDLCTGSGCLAILAALRWPEAKADAVDLSEDALEVARRNVADYGLGKRIRLVKSDLFSALGGRSYDLILSNPPYVKAASMRRLPDEFRKEPQLALASGRDGLDHTRRILTQGKRHLEPGGTLMVEIGHNRKALEKAYPQLPFRWPKVSAGAGHVFTLKREELP